MSKKVLVIGNGGREHAIVWKLLQSKEVLKVYVNNATVGMKNVRVESINLPGSRDSFNQACSEWCLQNAIDLVVVGPEAPLVDGIADKLSSNGIKCFGPNKAAARIESDKDWAKQFFDRHGIPTARWASFTAEDSSDCAKTEAAKKAREFIECADFPALVVKASGLAAGKGVIVATNKLEAIQAVESMLLDDKFGLAGRTVVVEELLDGEEVSVLAFCDGTSICAMLPAQDHKRHLDGDKGGNTGGMGAYCPCPLLSDAHLQYVTKHVIQKTVDGLCSEGHQFIGVLYAGLMITKDGPKVLEYNCRFGDPETQVILPLLKSDLFEVMMACCSGELNGIQLLWEQSKHAVGVVMASKGYPDSSSKGDLISGIDSLAPDLLVFHSGTAMIDSSLATNGGRVLIVVALATDLAMAASKATSACGKITFQGAQYRNDISHKGIARWLLQNGDLTYKSSGVDISAGDSLVSRIKPLVAATHRSGVLGSIGGFGGLFDAKAAGYVDPLLVSGTDGVGTKLKLAQHCQMHSTIGIDLVAMCVNDILANAAEPLFFLDYFACGVLDVATAAEIVAGVAEGCLQAGCALIGGETAEMPGLYAKGDYDLAGFAVGAVERNKLLPLTNQIIPGDMVIGVSSSGLHSNGFSLVRKVMERSKCAYSDVAAFSDTNATYGQELLTPTKIYVESLLPTLRSGKVKAFAHITGGGLTENIPRVLPGGVAVTLDAAHWPMQKVFGWLAAIGGIVESEMLRTFNCGIGGVLIVSKADVNDVMDLIGKEGAYVIGTCVQQVQHGAPQVNVANFEPVMEALMRPYIANVVRLQPGERKRVAVLISGSGTNLQSLIDATLDPCGGSNAEIVLVISNKPGVAGLARAEKANIPTKVIMHGSYATRLDFDMALHAALTAAKVDIVCLAGFMRVLTGDFVRLYRGRLLNIHPALLPLFKGTHAHRQALQAGVTITGATAHFVEEDVDAGAILLQEAVQIHPGDTESILEERVKLTEHRLYPRALALVATETVKLGDDNKLVWRSSLTN